MGEVKRLERIFRVVGVQRGERRVWRYRSEPDARWRAQELHFHPTDELIEFSYADIKWLPAPASWWTKG